MIIKGLTDTAHNCTMNFFIKFGARNDVVDLYENGTVYINTLQYYRTSEEKQRGDAYEGASRVINSLPGSFEIPGLKHTVNYLSVHIKEAHEYVYGNAYCVFCASSYTFRRSHHFFVHPDNATFGTHGIMIKRPDIFIKKVQDELKRLGYKSKAGFVRYYDKMKFTGHPTVFQKPLEFEHQKEFRIYVESMKGLPIKIHIGSIKEYSEIFTTEQILSIRNPLYMASGDKVTNLV